VAFFLINPGVMAECSFNIDFDAGADRIVETAAQAITAAGGKFSGDVAGGEFSLSAGMISVKGSYAIDGSRLNIVITRKPVMISCSRIEKEIRKYLQADQY
jgi:hypothetical protein